MTRPIPPPIIVFTYNRPELLARLLSSIRIHQPSKMYIFCDGPKNDFDIQQIAKIQKVIEEEIDWACKYEVIYASKNQGLANSISGGISSVFENEREAIVFEDDILPGPDFIPFCSELIDKYRDSNISQISGHYPLKNHFYNHVINDNEYSYYFSRYCLVWGWATWKSSWSFYRHDVLEMLPVLEGDMLNRIFEDERSAGIWRSNIQKVISNKDFKQWAIRWQVSNWIAGRMAIIPIRNLCSHSDISGLSSHVHKFDYRNNVNFERIIFPLRHKERFEVSKELDVLAEKIHFNPKNFIWGLNIIFRNFQSLIEKFGEFFGKLCLKK